MAMRLSSELFVTIIGEAAARDLRSEALITTLFGTTSRHMKLFISPQLGTSEKGADALVQAFWKCIADKRTRPGVGTIPMRVFR
eukprot:COSAG05_NODE_14828_length_386_cov_0.564460_1_plen_84_part_00